MSLLQVRRKRRSRLRLLLPIFGVLLCAGSAIGLAIISTVLSEDNADDNYEGNTITYGLTLFVSGFDPHIHRSSELGIPFYSVYDTLIYRHPQTYDFVSGLAESWDISSDGLVYTFTLRQDVNFHDGTPFDANAVAVTLDRILNLGSQSQKALPSLGPYIGYVTFQDEPYKIELHLSEPYAPFLDSLSQPYLGIASPTALANTTNETYQFNQVGTGPFKLVKFVPGDRIVLERNRDYTWGPPYFSEYSDNSVERVIFRFYDKPETRRIGLESGDVQIVGELPPTDAELLLASQEFELLPQLVPGQPLQFFFNTRQFPTDNLAIRQAILTATNREAIVETVFFSQFSPTAYGPISAVTQFYDPSVQSAYLYSPEQSQILFTTAGVSDSDEDGTLDLIGRPLKLKVVHMDFGFLPEVTQLLESQWREIGLEVELVPVGSLPELIAVAESGDFNLLAFNDFGVDPSFLNRFYSSDGDNNWTGYTDPELDGWLLEAIRNSDPEQRRQFYSFIQQRIMDQALILPIRDYVNINGYSSNIDGLIYTAQGWWPLLTNLVTQE